MCYPDFLKYFNRMSICYDFTDDYHGIKYFGNWNEKNGGGIPYQNTPEQLKAFTTNEQYFFELKEASNKQTGKSHVFFSLA